MTKIKEEIIKQIVKDIIDSTPHNDFLGIERDAAIQKVDEIRDMILKEVIEYYHNKSKST